MKKSIRRQVLNRMNYLIGHLEGIKKMIEDEKYCIDIIKQNKAVIAAIKKLNRIILENHLNTCVTEAIKGKSEKERKKKIKKPVNKRIIIGTGKLKNHPLKGKYTDYRSINITDNLRAIYKFLNENECIFVAVDTHSNLYF